jgi:ABC-type polysaccharide/polyol phosphate export permease
VLLTGAYFILVVTVLGRTEPAYLLFLLCALLPFRYFSGVVSGSLNLVKRHSSILINRSFPRAVLPLVTVASEGLSFMVSLGLLGPLMAYYIVRGDTSPPSLALVWLPLIVAVLGVLTAGASYIAAVFGLYFPDFRSVVQSVIRVLFFMSTGLVRFRRVPGEELPQLLKANPLSGIFDSVRSVIIAGEAPAPRDVLYPLAVGVILLVAGWSMYRWRAPHFAKEV